MKNKLKVGKPHQMTDILHLSGIEIIHADHIIVLVFYKFAAKIRADKSRSACY